ncbi:hypothetical protein F4811DRAFT_562087 [Daldinia bambusicola]|nr:hypothetical protein F4811DRAFT_562087 [Daldinia bambusicola]
MFAPSYIISQLENSSYALANQDRSETIKGNPITNGFDGFRKSSNSDCETTTKPLLAAVIASKSDEEIWTHVYHAWLRNTSSFVNSCEHRKYVDDVLKQELSPVYAGLSDFYETYFRGVVGLDVIVEAVFRSCTEGEEPLFGCESNGVLNWFTNISDKSATLIYETVAEGAPACRRSLAQLNKPIQGSTAERKIDVGFINSHEILILGELKNSLLADTTPKAWLDIRRFAREVLSVHDTRRFVIAFTLCGSFMTQLGFDPTIITSGGKRYIEIDRNGCKERLVVDAVMKRAPCIAGRGTTCWKAYSERDPRTPLVIENSLQYTERGEDGELLPETTNNNVINIGRYYHHYTVQVHGTDNDMRSNVRERLDIMMARNYCTQRPTIPTVDITTVGSGEDRGTTLSQKRSASQMDASVPPGKRSCLVSPTGIYRNALPNRIHRRLIIQQRQGASRVKGKAGTRAFMAVGALLGDQYFFVHDLESLLDDEFFIEYYESLNPLVNKMRKAIFPNGER